MWQSFKNVAFSLNGIYILVGALGSIASVISLFLPNLMQYFIPARYFIGLFFILITTSMIFLTIIYNQSISISAEDEITVVKFIRNINLFITDKNNLLGSNATVSIYYTDNEVDYYFGYGYVINIQSKLIQIKLVEIDPVFIESFPTVPIQLDENNIDTIKRFKIKTYISYTVFEAKNG